MAIIARMAIIDRSSEKAHLGGSESQESLNLASISLNLAQFSLNLAQFSLKCASIQPQMCLRLTSNMPQ